MKNVNLLGAAGVVLAVVVAAGPARADVLSGSYDASLCLGDSKANNNLTRDSANKKITNNTGANRDVYCPIARTTSGRDVNGAEVTNDKLLYVDVPVQTNGPTVTCWVSVWASYIDADGWNEKNRVVKWPSLSRTSAGTLHLVPGTTNPSRWWTANGAAQDPPRWYYADVSCTLPNGTSINSYKINEQGTNRPGYRIYPAGNCQPDPTNSIPWQYNAGGGNVPQVEAGGIVRGQSGSDGTKFAFQCKVPHSDLIDFSVARATGGNQLGCSLSNNNLQFLTWRASLGSNEFPSETLRAFGQNVISIPIVRSGEAQHFLACGVNSASGDGKLLSYRSRPHADRQNWGVWTSTGGTPDDAIDNNPGSRWTTGADGASGQWYAIDFITPRTVNQVIMDSGDSTGDYARSFVIERSDNSVNWTTVATVTGNTKRYVEANFSEQNTRYLRVRLTAGFSKWWSIHELNVYSVWDP